MTCEHLTNVMVRCFIDAVAAGIDLVPVVADSTSTAKIKPFIERYPGRLVNVGIAEQSMVGTAAGLALGGKVAATCNAAPFLIARANEQVKVDVCYSRSNVKMFGLNAGASYGPLASSHHAIDDISVMRGFGHVEIYAPSDPREAKQIIDYALRMDGPVYIRLDGKPLPELHDDAYRFLPGQVDLLRDGGTLALVALGSVVHEAVAAAERLQEQGIAAKVLNLSSIRPLQKEQLIAHLDRVFRVITVEEHNINGGAGSLVAETLLENGFAGKLTRLGISDGGYALAGDRASMRRHHQIDAEGIVTAATQ